MSARITPTMVEVEWIDSTAAHGWQDSEDGFAGLDDLTATTVGLLVADEPDYIVVALATGAGSERNVLCPLTIPRLAVVDIYHLVRAEFEPDDLDNVI
jgi:hypothetical protein